MLGKSFVLKSYPGICHCFCGRNSTGDSPAIGEGDSNLQLLGFQNFGLNPKTLNPQPTHILDS